MFQLIKVKTESREGDVNLENKTQKKKRSAPTSLANKDSTRFFFCRGCAAVTCTDLRLSVPARFLHTPAGVAASPKAGKHQCQRKDERHSPVGASVTLLIFLIEFIYLSSFNNLRRSTQWYANELFKFNEFLMTRQIISRARCGVHVI